MQAAAICSELGLQAPSSFSPNWASPRPRPGTLAPWHQGLGEMLAKKSRKPKLILTLKPGAGLAPPVLGGNLGPGAREATCRVVGASEGSNQS